MVLLINCIKINPQQKNTFTLCKQLNRLVLKSLKTKRSRLKLKKKNSSGWTKNFYFVSGQARAEIFLYCRLSRAEVVPIWARPGLINMARADLYLTQWNVVGEIFLQLSANHYLSSSIEFNGVLYHTDFKCPTERNHQALDQESGVAN